MEKLTAKLETVTPLLLGGANSGAGGSPELRPPSFRGVMRYWLRAVLGGVIGDANLEHLHTLESAVFGSTEVGSAVSIRLRPLGSLEESTVYVLPHKGKVRRTALRGRFQLVMSQVRADPVVWDAACASLELALTFGGVGQRARRGYGAVRIVEAKGHRLSGFPTTLEGWKSHINKAARFAVAAGMGLADTHQVHVSGLPKGPATFPCATTEGMIRLCNLGERSAMEAVKFFMNQVPKNSALGGINPRQASPLWIRPVQTGRNRYGLLCTVLASSFKGADYGFVRRFLDSFEGEYVSVKGWNDD